ncbi:hypothetical protein ACFP1Z_27825 [Streptomyces gamaensis]|uniref:Methylamine utilization protein MauE n=1 Tax=Streptomyces gamaensis TaxID=1763542 RepID=A0ABW0Z573_9ACTN
MTAALLALCAAAALAVVAFAVTAKLLDWPRTQLRWPVRGRAAWLVGPVHVVVLETVVVLLVITPGGARPRCAVLAVLFLGYGVAAAVLRGRTCGCFGAGFTTRFGYGHAAACFLASGVLGAAAALVTVPAHTASLGAADAALTGAAVAAGLWWPRARAEQRATDPARIPLIERIVVYGSSDCPHCKGLWTHREQLAAISAHPVEFQLVDRLPGGENARRAALAEAGGAVPAAVGYRADGQRVYGPAVGTVPIRDLLRATG